MNLTNFHTISAPFIKNKFAVTLNYYPQLGIIELTVTLGTDDDKNGDKVVHVNCQSQIFSLVLTI